MHFWSSAANQPSVPDSVIDPALLTISNTSQILLHLFCMPQLKARKIQNPQPASTLHDPLFHSCATLNDADSEARPKAINIWLHKTLIQLSQKLTSSLSQRSVRGRNAFVSMQKYVTMLLQYYWYNKSIILQRHWLLAQARISKEHATKRRQFDLQERELNLRAAEAGWFHEGNFTKLSRSGCQTLLNHWSLIIFLTGILRRWMMRWKVVVKAVPMKAYWWMGLGCMMLLKVYPPFY